MGKIVSELCFENVNHEIKKFPDGEIGVKIYDNLHQKELILTHQLFPEIHENLVQLLFLIAACKKAGAKKIYAILPYLAYGRIDHKVESVDFTSTACIASLLESTGLNKLIIIDLHSNNIKGFFSVPVKSIDSLELFKSHLRKIVTNESVIVSPDIGGKPRADNISKFFNTPLTVLHKKRIASNKVFISPIAEGVKNKHCILVDDMISTGETIVEAINILQAAEAKSIDVIVTHNLLGSCDIKKLNQIAKTVNEVNVSNTIQIPDNTLYSPNISITDISIPIINYINLHF
jgi:ribose-phosphate pyrophosphokinase